MITLKSKAVSMPVSNQPIQHVPAQQPISGGMAPPMQTVQPAAHPEESFLVKNRWIVLGGAVLLAILLVALTWLIFADSSRNKSAELLVSTAPRVDAVSADVASAIQVRGFQRASRRADTALPKIEQAKIDAQQISDGEIRQATITLLDAEREYMNAVQGLGSIRRVGDDQFVSSADEVDDAARSVDSAVRAMAQFELAADPTPYPNRRSLRAAESNLNKIAASG